MTLRDSPKATLLEARARELRGAGISNANFLFLTNLLKKQSDFIPQMTLRDSPKATLLEARARELRGAGISNANFLFLTNLKKNSLTLFPE